MQPVNYSPRCINHRSTTTTRTLLVDPVKVVVLAARVLKIGPGEYSCHSAEKKGEHPGAYSHVQPPTYKHNCVRSYSTRPIAAVPPTVDGAAEVVALAVAGAVRRA